MRVNSGNGPVTIDTNQMIGSGGEAKVYAVKGQRKSVAKIYIQPTTERATKLRTMVGKPPVDPGHSQGHVSIAWPEDVLTDKSGMMVGYLMPIIQNSFPFHDVYNTKARRQLLPPGFGYQYLLRTAHNLCTAVAAVHDMGYVIGDLNDCNILVQADARVTLIDCDSFQVGTHRCPVGVPMYIAPEIQGVTLSSIDRQVEQDNFALAILVYQLLMSGFHPYAGVGEPGELGERIKGALCSHVPHGPKPPPRAPKLEWLPTSLQQMVKSAFADGHNTPKVRPEARIWAGQLLNAEKELVICRRNPSHPHFNHFRKCPACLAEAARSKQTRGNRARQKPVKMGQQPLPGLRSRHNRPIRSRLALFAVLFVAFALAYYWPVVKNPTDFLNTLKGNKGWQATRNPTNRNRSGNSTVKRNIKIESASKIYKKSIGKSPYSAQPSQVQINKSQLGNAATISGNKAVSGNREHYIDESASETYQRQIGTKPYRTGTSPNQLGKSYSIIPTTVPGRKASSYRSESHDAETGSDIYQKQIGVSPYQPRTSRVQVNLHHPNRATTVPRRRPVPPGKEHH